MNQVKAPVKLIQANAPDNDLVRIARAIRRTGKNFALFFVECNLPELRQKLAIQLNEQLATPAITVDLGELDKLSEQMSLDKVVASQLIDTPDNAPVFLLGLEHMLPTLSKEKLRSTVQQLNWRRSAFARLQRPLVIWLPSYALKILAEQAPDFYDWYSGTFSFSSDQEDLQQEENFTFQGLWKKGIHAGDYSTETEKKRWLVTLKGLLDEHQEQDSARADLLINTGYLLKGLGDYKQAIEYYQQALNLQKEIEDEAEIGTTLNNISQVYHSRGDYNTTLDYLKQSLKSRQKINDKAGESAALNNMAATSHALGDLDTALIYLDKSLSIQRAIGDKSGESATLNNLAQIFKSRDDYDTALGYLKQSLKITQEIGNKSGEHITLNNISGIYRAYGDYDTALDYLKQSLKIAQKIGDRLGESSIFNNIATIAIARGDYHTARYYLKKSLDIRQEIGDLAGLCTATLNLGHLYWQSEEPHRAMTHWLSTYRIAKRIGHAQTLNSLEKLAKQLNLPGKSLQSWENLATEEDQQIPDQSREKKTKQTPKSPSPYKINTPNEASLAEGVKDKD